MPSVYIKSRNSELGMTSRSGYRSEKTRMDVSVVVVSIRIAHITWQFAHKNNITTRAQAEGAQYCW